MADLLETPQYALPFRLDESGEPVCIEQDSEEDVAQNSIVVLRYVKGTRSRLVTYGLEDQTLQQNGADLNDIAATVRQWEPDSDISVVSEALDDDGIQTVRIDLGDVNG